MATDNNDQKKLLRWAGTLCILASAISMGIFLGIGKGSISLVFFGGVFMGIILIILSTQSFDKKD